MIINLLITSLEEGSKNAENTLIKHGGTKTDYLLENEMDLKVYIYDLEAFGGMFLFCAEDYETGKRFSFEISRRKNEADSLLRFLEDRKDYYFVGFNNIRYDSQVVEYINRNNRWWADLDGSEIAQKISSFSGTVIADQNYDSFPIFKEVCFKQIDLFKIHHFDNKNRACSLKWAGFSMDMPNIEELPFPHYKEDFTDSELDDIIKYCWNDIDTTKKLYDYTRGETVQSFYKGKDKIQDRLDIIRELGFPEETLHYSDVKIGDEINKRGYCAIKGITERHLVGIRRSRKPTRKFTYGDCVPPYIRFSSGLRDSVRNILNKPVRIQEEVKIPVSFKGARYVIARGGIHSSEKARLIVPGPNEILRDADVGSQHPTAIVKRGLFPDHLGPEWLISYRSTTERRNVLKEQIKASTDDSEKQRLKGVSEMLKLALNGGGFGKTIDPTNWQYGPEVGFGCTIGNQFEILMLIEWMELAGIKVVSANTDGILCLFDRSLEGKYKEICAKWEETVGNTTLGKLEFTDFKLIAQESVNHYVAVKADGSLKIKGRLAVDGEVNKNNTKDLGRIERKAIVNYFAYGTPVEKTVLESRNIFDFVYGVKSSSDYHYETVKGNDITVHKKIIRYYISKEGERLLKIKNENSEKTGNPVTRIAGGKNVVICNDLRGKQWQDFNIDFEHYINAASVVVHRIEGNKMVNKAQLSLF